MTLINSQTLRSAAATVTFSSIPGTYRDLRLILQTTVVSGAEDVTLRFNGDSGSNYSRVQIAGTGSTTSSGVASSVTFAQIDVQGAPITTVSSMHKVDILDYAQTDKHKTFLSRSDSASGGVDAMAHRWASTSVVTSITLGTTGVNFNTGSTFYLYGIAG